MYIDEYKVTVKGSKWNHKTQKQIKDVTKVEMESTDGINHKAFVALMDELKDTHEVCTIKVTVEMSQHEYE